jgi:Fe-S-cluster containining protein
MEKMAEGVSSRRFPLAAATRYFQEILMRESGILPAADAADKPWYQEGLRFRCTRCGLCCTGAPGYVWVTAEEIRAIAAFLGEAEAEVEARHTRRVGPRRSLREKANGDCIFYDRRAGCTIYPVRPRQCRTWPFWYSNVCTPQAWERTCQVCPGAGQGDLIPAEEITRRLRVIRL